MENEIRIFDTIKLIESALGYNFCGHEKQTYQELLSAINENDIDQLNWFSQFGTSKYYEINHSMSTKTFINAI